MSFNTTSTTIETATTRLNTIEVALDVSLSQCHEERIRELEEKNAIQTRQIETLMKRLDDLLDIQKKQGATIDVHEQSDVRRRHPFLFSLKGDPLVDIKYL